MPDPLEIVRFVLRDSAGLLIVYQCMVLLFELVAAPRMFTETFFPLRVHLHMEGCVIFPYLDDSFHAQATLSQVPLTCDASLRLHFMVGFIVNLFKEIGSLPYQGVLL